MEFKSLKIIEPILASLEKQGYEKPSPIQEKTIPLLLDNKDVIGIAQTGTGKTAAFVIPIIQKLHKDSAKLRSKLPKALILAPTRELAAQINVSFRNYGSFLDLRHLPVYGGVGIHPQIRELRNGVDILIATPGRLLDLMEQKKVNLEEIEFLVLDEADRMLDMGFLKDVNKILQKLPKERQTLLFSATMSKDVEELTRKFLKNPVKIEITPQSTPVEKIEQCVFFVDQENKSDLLLDLINEHNMSCMLIFVGMKYKADKIAKILRENGIRADSLHGNKTQYQRTKTLKDFKKGKLRALVATDIAARGIDVENISHVINYDLPNEPENYVHRIGRTARAGKEGTAYSFCAAKEKSYLEQIEIVIGKKTVHAEHKYHSIKAKNATGRDAKPDPRGSRQRFGRSNDGGRRNGNSFRDRRPSNNDRGKSGGRTGRFDRTDRTDKRPRYNDKRPSNNDRSGSRFDRTDKRPRDSDRFDRTDRTDRTGRRPRDNDRRVPERKPYRARKSEDRKSGKKDRGQRDDRRDKKHSKYDSKKSRDKKSDSRGASSRGTTLRGSSSRRPSRPDSTRKTDRRSSSKSFSSRRPGSRGKSRSSSDLRSSGRSKSSRSRR
jgi:ATP-dependent RNA helicase RhlE